MSQSIAALDAILRQEADLIATRPQKKTERVRKEREERSEERGDEEGGRNVCPLCGVCVCVCVCVSHTHRTRHTKEEKESGTEPGLL